jgi:hypothetical protein
MKVAIITDASLGIGAGAWRIGCGDVSLATEYASREHPAPPAHR